MNNATIQQRIQFRDDIKMLHEFMNRGETSVNRTTAQNRIVAFCVEFGLDTIIGPEYDIVIADNQLTINPKKRPDGRIQVHSKPKCS